MRKISILLMMIPGLLLATANYVYHDPTGTSDNPAGYEYRNGVVNNNNAIYDNEATTIAVKVEYKGWIDNVKIAYTTDGMNPTFADNPTALDWWDDGTSDGTGQPQVWGKNSVIPQQSIGTTVKYILFAYDSGIISVIYANGGGEDHDELGEATIFSFTVLDDASLPVELSTFFARSSVRGVELNWTTDSEIENQGFILSRKSDGESWREIASFATQKALEGQGSTTQATDYSFVDTQVGEGLSYTYQLSDVDYSGKRTDHTKQVETITYVNPGENVRPQALELVNLYPNPFNPTVTLSYDLSEMADLSVSVYNLAGELVWSHSEVSHPAGQNNKLAWNGTDLKHAALPSGIYLVNIQAGAQSLSKKVTLLR